MLHTNNDSEDKSNNLYFKTYFAIKNTRGMSIKYKQLEIIHIEEWQSLFEELHALNVCKITKLSKQ